jgi:hypothetical protein
VDEGRDHLKEAKVRPAVGLFGRLKLRCIGQVGGIAVRPRGPSAVENLHGALRFEVEGGRALIALDGPHAKRSDSASGGRHPGDASGFGLFEPAVISAQDWRMFQQRIQRPHQGATQTFGIAGLEAGFPAAFALARTRVIPSTHQARPAKNLAGGAIVRRVAERGRQAGHPHLRHTLQAGPDVIRGLSQQEAQLLFQMEDMVFDVGQQSQVLLQEVASNRGQLGIRWQDLLGVGQQLGGSAWPQGVMLGVEGRHQVGGRHRRQLAWVGADSNQTW